LVERGLNIMSCCSSDNLAAKTSSDARDTLHMTLQMMYALSLRHYGETMSVCL
jgi:hypothetical protein